MRKENLSNTNHYIVEALFRLLKVKSLEKIQVIEICIIAGVGRSTFYKHFNHKGEIINFYLEYIYKESLKTAIIHPETNEDFEENIIILIKTIYSQKEYLSLLLKNGLGQRLLDFLTKKFILFNFNNSNENYFFPYIVSGAIYNALFAWNENNYENDIMEVFNSILIILKLYNPY